METETEHAPATPASPASSLNLSLNTSSFEELLKTPKPVDLDSISLSGSGRSSRSLDSPGTLDSPNKVASPSISRYRSRHHSQSDLRRDVLRREFDSSERVDNVDNEKVAASLSSPAHASSSPNQTLDLDKAIPLESSFDLLTNDISLLSLQPSPQKTLSHSDSENVEIDKNRVEARNVEVASKAESTEPSKLGVLIDRNEHNNQGNQENKKNVTKNVTKTENENENENKTIAYHDTDTNFKPKTKTSTQVDSESNAKIEVKTESALALPQQTLKTIPRRQSAIPSTSTSSIGRPSGLSSSRKSIATTVGRRPSVQPPAVKQPQNKTHRLPPESYKHTIRPTVQTIRKRQSSNSSSPRDVFGTAITTEASRTSLKPRVTLSSRASLLPSRTTSTAAAPTTASRSKPNEGRRTSIATTARPPAKAGIRPPRASVAGHPLPKSQTQAGSDLAVRAPCKVGPVAAARPRHSTTTSLKAPMPRRSLLPQPPSNANNGGNANTYRIRPPQRPL